MDVLIIVFGVIALIPTLGPPHVLVYSSRSSSFRGLSQQEYRFANPRSAPITGLSVDWSFSTPPDNGFVETVAPAAQLQKRRPTQANASIVYHFELAAPLPAISRQRTAVYELLRARLEKIQIIVLFVARLSVMTGNSESFTSGSIDLVGYWPSSLTVIGLWLMAECAQKTPIKIIF